MMQLDPNPVLHRFTVFLRSEDRLRKGVWDELAFVVTVSPAAPSPSVFTPLEFPQISSPPVLPLPDTVVDTANTLDARIAARVRPDGRLEFALAPEGASRILPQVRSISVTGTASRWLTSSNVVLNQEPLGRISVRRVANGRIEFSFLPADGGSRILPEQRIFRPSGSSNSWRLSSAIRIPTPQGCRASESDNGIAFPTRRVKLHPNASTVYRVSGVGTTGGPVTYLVCADNQSISDDTRDKVLFAAGYYYSTDPEFDSIAKYVEQLSGSGDAERGLTKYQEGFRTRAWANILKWSGTAANVAVALHFYSADLSGHLANRAQYAAKESSHYLTETAKIVTQFTAEHIVDEHGFDIAVHASEEILHEMTMDSCGNRQQDCCRARVPRPGKERHMVARNP